jgi:translation initiation factor IF-2
MLVPRMSPKQEDVDIRLHSIIYKVEEEITAAMIGMLDAIKKEVILGKALVRKPFKVSKIGTIAGCRVTDGVIAVRLRRGCFGTESLSDRRHFYAEAFQG